MLISKLIPSQGGMYRDPESGISGLMVDHAVGRCGLLYIGAPRSLSNDPRRLTVRTLFPNTS